MDCGGFCFEGLVIGLVSRFLGFKVEIFGLSFGSVFGMFLVFFVFGFIDLFVDFFLGFYV